MKKSCIRCDNYISCKDPHRSIIFFCSRYKETKQSLMHERHFLEDALEVPFATSTLGTDVGLATPEDDPSMFDAYRSLIQVLDDKRMVSPDIKIPEGDFATAPNFYTWCVGDQFLNQKPFVMQALIGTKLFGEHCPDCSDVEWMEHGIKASTSLDKFVRKVALLEHGVCPHCHKTKLHFYRNKSLAPYWELALNAGQRCVTADTLMLTQDGIVAIGDYAENRPYGFSDFGVRVETGTDGMRQTSQFYRARAERCHHLKTKHGFSVRGTRDHPVMTLQGFKKLSQITEQDHLRVYFGQQAYGNKATLYRDITDQTDAQFEQWYAGLKNIHRSNVIRPRKRAGYGKGVPLSLDAGMARFLGYWVAEGRGRSLSNTDPMVLDDCFAAFAPLFSDGMVRKAKQGIEFSNTYVQMWLANLVGSDVHAGSAHKQVPRCILQGSKQIQQAFLAALFEGDGCATSHRMRNGTRYHIEYTSISRTLVQQVSVMLLNMGIVHRMSVGKTWATNGSPTQVEKSSYTILITGPMMQVFQEEIGFLSPRKQDRLAVAVQHCRGKVRAMPFYYEKCPPELESEFFSVLRSVQLQLNQLTVPGKTGIVGLQSLFGKEYSLRRLRRGCVTKADILNVKPLLSEEFCFDLATTARLTALLEFAEGSYFYSPVVSNKLTQKEYETYDITVPGPHRFLSNGLLSHNSGKSALFGMLASYLTHRMIKLEKPNEVLGLLKANVLQGTFVALTFAQAKDTLWEPFYGHLLESPWFTAYHQMLDMVQQHHGEDEVYKLKDTFVLYRHRRIQVYPAGPDKRVLRGRCLTGGTLVNTNLGFVHFNELISAHGQVPVKGLLIDSHKGAKKVSHTYKDVSETINIRTRNGFRLSGTPEHPMLVLQPDLTTKWVRLDELKLGDWIVSTTKCNSPLFGTAEVDKNVATLAGYMVANGYKNTVSSNDPAVVSRLYKCVKRLTGSLPYSTCGDRSIRADTHYLPGNGRGVSGTFVSEWLNPIGYRDARSNKKEIPLSIRCAPKKVLHEFLEAYFECDSGVNGGGSQRNSAPSEIEVGSSSRKLALQLHTILFHAYGILGRVKTSVCHDKLNRATGLYTGRREHWIVSITGCDAYRFIQTFKRAKVQKYADRFHNVPAGYGSDRRAVPYVRKFVRDIYEQARMQSDDGRRLRTLLCENGERVTKRYPRPTFMVNSRSKHSGDILNAPLPEFVAYGENWNAITNLTQRLDSAATKRLHDFLSEKGHYEQVTSIKTGKRKTVYDVTVPDGHAFTANCLTSHNTRFLAGIDELGWFPNGADAAKNVKMNANEVYIALERSLLTVRSKASIVARGGFYNVPFGYFINISSPSSSRDKIMELVRKSQGSRRLMGLSSPTWKMNPHVPKSALAEEFRKDPVAAMRDYGAQPPLTNSPMLSSHERLELCFSKKVNSLKMRYKVVRSKDKSATELYGELDEVRSSGKPSILALDAGYSNNSFAFAVGHLAPNGYPAISLVGEIMPSPGSRLNHSLIYTHLLSEIIPLRNVVLVCADRWNSLKILADMEQDFGVAKRQYSLKYADMQLFKSYIDDLQLLLPRPTAPIEEILKYDHSQYPDCFKHKPADHLVLQALTVQDTGSAVIKGDGLTDDILRAGMLCFRMLIDEDNHSLLTQPEAEVQSSFDLSTMVVSKYYSGGGSGGGSSGGGVGQGSSLGVIRSRQ